MRAGRETKKNKGLCEYVILHMILPPSQVILWIELGGKPKWLPLKFGHHAPEEPLDCLFGRRSGKSVTASDFGSNGPRFESGRGRCVESLDKALYSHCLFVCLFVYFR